MVPSVHSWSWLTSQDYSHLPDITLITPVFDEDTHKIIFFTASRGHHADIGGILPGKSVAHLVSAPYPRLLILMFLVYAGSMPPTSVNIFEEGAEILSFKIVRDGVFDREGLVDYMCDRPAKYPGNSGCRNFRDVESDLKAVSWESNRYLRLEANGKESTLWSANRSES